MALSLDDAKKRAQEIDNIIKNSSVSTTQAKKLLTELQTMQTSSLGSQITQTKEWSDAFLAASSKVNVATEETGSIFDSLFEEFKDGFTEMRTKFDELIQVQTDLGSNIQFWKEYHRRVREVGVEYGVSINKLKEFAESNLAVEKSFVETGLSVEEYKQGLETFYDTTDRLTQLTPEFGKNLGNISQALGVNITDAAKFLGSMNNLNVSFNDSVKLLEDLRYAAEKSALNTSKVSKAFTENFEKLNTYSFSKGVQGMMDMVIQSQKLKVNMDQVLSLSDKFTDPEQTMEFASNMQMLGGSFAQLGDFNQLMYDAAVAPEELAKNIANATKSVGTFNRETGKIDLSYADRLQMKEFEKATGMSVIELNKMNSAARKLEDIKMSFNMRPLTDEQADVISSMAQFDTGRGEYTVKVGGETKSVATLSDEDIKKIAEDKQKSTLEEQRVAKMDVEQLSIAKMEGAKYSSLDTIKAGGYNNEELRQTLNTTMGLMSDSLQKNVKEKIFAPLESLGDEKLSKGISDTVKNFTSAVGTITTFIGDKAKIMMDALPEEVKKEYNRLSTPDNKKEKGDILTAGKFSEGNILQGLPHSQGGIPFSIDKKLGFEAEGGEVLLSKGVSQDPLLLSLASRINEVGGGKKLYEDGGVINNSSINESNFINKTSKYESLTNVSSIGEKMSQLNNVINNVIEQTSNNMMSTVGNIGRTQGGLIDKRGDMMGGSIDVGGAVKVDGNVTFSPISIKIEGTSATKEVDTNEKLQKDILSIVEDKIKNMNLYTQFVNKKGTGINDGKLVNMPGITTDIG
jgi:hypothetical protein